MTQEFENMLYLFGCGALGRKVDVSRCVDIKKIRDLAIAQNIWPIVYGAIRPLIISGEVKIPPEIIGMLENTNISNVAINIQKVEFTREILKQLSAAGFEICLLKGSTLARHYYQPQERISGDTDILINPVDEKAVSDFLTKKGYEVEARESHEHHFRAMHKKGGILEVHVTLVQKSVMDMVFYNMVEYNEPFITGEDNIKELGLNDGLVYNAVHFIKHFVKFGAGVRHIMDFLLYMKKHEDKLDMNSFYELMKKLRYDRLIDVLKSIGVIYWGFEFENFSPVEKEIIDEVLTDIENGGIFGYGEKNRRYAYRVFSEKRTTLTDKEFKKHSINNLNKSLFRKIFPEKAYMFKFYPETKNSFINLLRAYIKRWGNLILKLLMGKRSVEQYIYSKNEKENSSEVSERIQLMEKLDIIDRS